MNACVWREDRKTLTVMGCPVSPQHCLREGIRVEEEYEGKKDIRQSRCSQKGAWIRRQSYG